jgi:predicted esterase
MFILLILFAESLDFTVSGFSSGAFMTMQLHLSYSDHISGVGIIAGAPYHCAQASFLPNACTTVPFLINTDELIFQARSHESKGLISAK